jgi:hypothetical protein
VRLPEALRQQLFGTGRPPTVASLSASVTSAYLASTRYFDGQRDTPSFVMASRALNESGAVPERMRVPVSSNEQRLGDLISAELQSVLATTPSGRVLLNHFSGRDGVVRLPPLMVLKMTQRADDPNAPGAAYYDETRQVIFNHWELARVLLEQVPPAERARRAREFSDANALRLYLEAHPAERRRLVESVDHLILHELVHYRQGDVARIMTETRRGNVPGPSLSVEHEAHRQECRYFLERVAADPSLLTAGYGGNRQEYCPTVLRDPGKLDNYVTDLYMRTYAGSMRLPDLSRMQDTRRSAALATIMSGDATWTERFNQGLKIVGLARGDAAIVAERRRIEAATSTRSHSSRYAYRRPPFRLRLRATGNRWRLCVSCIPSNGPRRRKRRVKCSSPSLPCWRPATGARPEPSGSTPSRWLCRGPTSCAYLSTIALLRRPTSRTRRSMSPNCRRKPRRCAARRPSRPRRQSWHGRRAS